MGLGRSNKRQNLGRNPQPYAPDQNPLPVKQQTRHETADDYLVDIADLFVDPHSSKDYGGNRSPCSDTLPVAGESMTGQRRARSTKTEAYMNDGPIRCPSNLHGDLGHPPVENHYTNVVSIGLSLVASQSRCTPDGSSSMSRGYVQSALLKSSSPSQETSYRDQLPTNDVDSGFESKSAEIVLQTTCQPRQIAPRHLTGSANASRNIISPPVSDSLCNIPSPKHENGPSQENTQSKSPSLTTTPYTEMSSSSFTPSVNSSENTAATGIPNFGALPAIHSMGPYSRRPSNHPSFLQYDRD